MEYLVIPLLLFAAGLWVLIIAALVQAGWRRGKRAVQRRSDAASHQRVNALHAAATDSDAGARRQLEAVDVNVQNPDGDSALHLA